jgi:hypothetical protein
MNAHGDSITKSLVQGIPPESRVSNSSWPFPVDPTRLRPSEGKTCLAQGLAREHLADLKRRRQQGQAAVARAVSTSLASYRN